MDEPWSLFKGLKGFGPWASWKALDLLDCVMKYRFNLDGIDFRVAYEFPLKGLLMVNKLPEDLSLLDDDKKYRRCMDTVYKMLGDVLTMKNVPHNDGRGVRLNEIETLLCKYHSYMHGHYEPGEDIARLVRNVRNSPYKEINKFPLPW